MKQILEPQKTGYLPSLDGLRCLSILLVIVTHINYAVRITSNETISLYLTSAVFGVHVFFVISGFIITTLLLKEQARTGSISLGNFYFRRVLRILPLAYFFLIVLLLLNSYGHLRIPSLDFATAFLFVKNAVPVHGFRQTEHYWSLSVEEQYYWIFPLILSRGLRPYLIVCFSYIGIFCCKNILEHFLHTAGDRGIAHAFDILFSNAMVSIILGSLTSILLFKAGDRVLTTPWKTIPLVFAQVGAFLLALFLWVHPKFFGLTAILGSCLIAFTLVLLVRFPYGPVFRLFNTKPVIFIGKLSFSLYIWQQLFTFYQPWANWFKYGNAVLFNMIALSCVAVASHYLIEKPFLRLRDRFKTAASPGPAKASSPSPEESPLLTPASR